MPTQSSIQLASGAAPPPHAESAPFPVACRGVCSACIRQAAGIRDHLEPVSMAGVVIWRQPPAQQRASHMLGVSTFHFSSCRVSCLRTTGIVFRCAGEQLGLLVVVLGCQLLGLVPAAAYVCGGFGVGGRCRAARLKSAPAGGPAGARAPSHSGAGAAAPEVVGRPLRARRMTSMAARQPG